MCYAILHLNQDIRNSQLVSTLDDRDWEFIKKNAEIGKEFKDKLHSNFLPQEILEKLLKMV